MLPVNIPAPDIVERVVVSDPPWSNRLTMVRQMSRYSGIFLSQPPALPGRVNDR